MRACVLSRPAQCGTRSMGMDRNKMWPQIAIMMVMVAERVVGGVWCVVACGFFIFIALYFYFIYLYLFYFLFSSFSSYIFVYARVGRLGPKPVHVLAWRLAAAK